MTPEQKAAMKEKIKLGRERKRDERVKEWLQFNAPELWRYRRANPGGQITKLIDQEMAYYKQHRQWLPLPYNDWLYLTKRFGQRSPFPVERGTGAPFG